MVRFPAVAGHFYPGDETSLMAEIVKCFESPLGPGGSGAPKSFNKRTIYGGLSPHAGYIYSGPVAAHLYRKLWEQEPPSTVIILAPNHTGFGATVAVSPEDFQTPLGIVKADEELIDQLLGDPITVDSSAHAHEHSIEVQLPFMQYLGWDIKIVPICMALQDYDTAVQVGKRINEAIAKRDDVLVIASSDMSHYVPEKIARDVDGLAIEQILSLDTRGLHKTVVSNNISMCGLAPVIGMMEAVKGSKATLLKYGTSGDVHPMRDVVGYAAVSIEK